MITSPRPEEAMDFPTEADAVEAAAHIDAPLDLIQRVTFSDGRTVWHVIVPHDGRATYLAEL